MTRALRPIFPPSPDIVRRLVFTFGDAGTVWIAYTDQYRLVQLRLDSGDTLRIVETPFDLIPLMDAERDSAFRQLAPVGVRPEQIPTTRPVIHNLHRGPEGTLLVQLATSPQATESVFDVFDGEGRLLGRLRTPVRLVEGFLEPSARVYPDGIYGVVSDNLGVESLVRYRINRPSS